jgi:pyruvate/2-oxoglutarate dehydrogenase complex dihydrolipoamide dehydrogenase (E3) component
MLKLVTGKKCGEILGYHIVGAQAPGLIPEVCLTIKQETDY